MTRTQRGLLIAVAILLAFGCGFGWQYTRAQTLEGEVAAARRDLAFAELEATLAAAAVQAHRDDFEAARQLTSDFFTALQANIDRAPPDAREELASILGRRDQLITYLSRADPQGREMLTNTFLRYRVAIGGPERALPVPAGSADEAETPADGPPTS